jgi:type I restriction enzyme S subunit
VSKWPQHSLGAVIELAYGKSLPKNKRTDGGNIPVYGSNGIAGWHDESLLDGPAVIVGRKGSAGAVQFVDGPCYPIDTTYFVRPRDGFDFDIKFLFYMLRYLDLSRLKTATGVPGLTREDAYREMISVPPLPEQRRIVDLLSRAEGIVRLRREAEKKAAELIPALFLDMFGDPATNPKGWLVGTIGDVIESAEYGSSTRASSEGAGLPLIRMGNVDYAGNLDLGDLKYVELDDEEVRKYQLQAGDILFNRTNSKELVGKTGLWDGRCEAVVASYFIRVRVKRERLNPFYLWAFMNSAYMKRVLFETARGAIGQANINARELRAFKIPMPPLEAQDGFEKRCRDVAGLVFQQSTATAKAQAAFDALLASVFNQ